MPTPNFYRVFANARVLESVCENCSRTVGVATTPDILSIAERAHICPVAQPMMIARAAASS
jgi:hypothetical protein